MNFLIFLVTLTVFVSSVISVPAKTAGENLDGAIGVAEDTRDTLNEAANNVIVDLWNGLQNLAKNAADEAEKVTLSPELQAAADTIQQNLETTSNDVQEAARKLLEDSVNFLVTNLNNLGDEARKSLNGTSVALTVDPVRGLTATISLPVVRV